MKIFTPRHARQVITGIASLAAAIGISVYSLSRLAASSLSPMLLLWILLPAAGLPLAALTAYRLYGLLTAQYALDRNGFYLKWGAAEEHIPLGRIRGMTSIEELPASAFSPWKSLLGITGALTHEGRELEFFTAGDLEHAVLLTTDTKRLVLTPSDPVQFLQAYREYSYQGSLQRIKPLSIRPVFLAVVLMKDSTARWLLPSGLAVNLLLLAFLILGSTNLPQTVPFSFTAEGSVQMLAPLQRLLLLPLAGSLLWMMNSALGIWFYQKRSDRVIGYALWGASLIPGFLLWGAVINMLSSAGV